MSNLTPSFGLTEENKSFEYSEWPIKCLSVAIRLIFVSPPTYSKEHPISPTVFNDEFSEYLQGRRVSKEPYLNIEDSNFHVDDCSDKDAVNSNICYRNLDYNNM